MQEFITDDYRRGATLIRVVDGDTVDLDVDLGFHIRITERFRLLRINAPELRGKEREAGKKSHQALIEFLGDKPLSVLSLKQGGFRRWLAELYYWEDGEWHNVSTLMLKHGYAKPYKD